MLIFVASEVVGVVAGKAGMAPVARSDVLLADQVRALLEDLAAPRRHHVAAGLRLADGNIVTGVNVISNYGPNSICAEQAAIAEWAKSTGAPIVVIIAIRATFDGVDPFEVIPPCGRCRELACEYAPEAYFLLSARDGQSPLVRVAVGSLLPVPFRRRTLAEYRLKGFQGSE